MSIKHARPKDVKMGNHTALVYSQIIFDRRPDSARVQTLRSFLQRRSLVASRHQVGSLLP